jgi:hypothetical protein
METPTGPNFGEFDLTVTEAGTASDASGDIKRTQSTTLEAKEGLGDGFAISEDFKVDPTDKSNNTVSVSITKRFKL